MAKTGDKIERRETLRAFFKDLDDGKRVFALDTIDEYLFFLDEIEKLKKLPLIVFSDRAPQIQKTTPAGKQIKEYSQVIDAKRATLLRILDKDERGAADELAKILKQYE